MDSTTCPREKMAGCQGGIRLGSYDSSIATTGCRVQYDLALEGLFLSPPESSREEAVLPHCLQQSDVSRCSAKAA